LHHPSIFSAAIAAIWPDPAEYRGRSTHFHPFLLLGTVRHQRRENEMPGGSVPPGIPEGRYL